MQKFLKLCPFMGCFKNHADSDLASLQELNKKLQNMKLQLERFNCEQANYLRTLENYQRNLKHRFQKAYAEVHQAQKLEAEQRNFEVSEVKSMLKKQNECMQRLTKRITRLEDLQEDSDDYDLFGRVCHVECCIDRLQEKQDEWIDKLDEYYYKILAVERIQVAQASMSSLCLSKITANIDADLANTKVDAKTKSKLNWWWPFPYRFFRVKSKNMKKHGDNIESLKSEQEFEQTCVNSESK